MFSPEAIIELIEKMRVEWALEGARYSDRDVPPALHAGLVTGRDEAAQLILEGVKNLIREDEDAEKAR